MIKYKHQYWYSYAIALIALSLSFNIKANDITPNHVYQAVDTIHAELILLHEANESTPVFSDFKMTDRRPRHVIQKAREIFQKLQILRDINGLPKNTVPPFPTTEIIPNDVLNIVNLILDDVRELRGIFDVYQKIPEIPLPTNKKPNDVYLHLIRVCEMIYSLYVPNTVPNDVYQIATTIIGDIELIKQHRNIDDLHKDHYVLQYRNSQSYTPNDVYKQARVLLRRIKALCELNTDYCLEGGVVIPPEHQGKIKPLHVLDTLNNVLAELGSLKTNLKITQPTQIAAAVRGKTPNDVYEVVNTAINMVNTIK